MDRNRAKELLPIIKAFSEGKEIQKFIKNYTVGSDRWIDVNSIDTSDKREYRIKPKSKYCPFANAEECWAEMQKHQPIGWTKLIGGIEYSFITDVNDAIRFSDAIKEYIFADGTPFGVKVEE